MNYTSLPLALPVLLAALAPAAWAQSNPLPPKAAIAVVRVLTSDNLKLGPAEDARFLRYDARGKVEAFQCPAASAYMFYAFGSSSGGGITVGECPKSAQLDENMGTRQAAAFKTAVSTLDPAIAERLKAMEGVLQPVVMREPDGIFVHITQFLLSGVGGTGGHGAARMESLLMLPAGSKTAYLVQGNLPESACLPHLKLPICGDFRATLRTVARQTYGARAAGPESPDTSRR